MSEEKNTQYTAEQVLYYHVHELVPTSENLVIRAMEDYANQQCLRLQLENDKLRKCLEELTTALYDSGIARFNSGPIMTKAKKLLESNNQNG